MVEAADHLILSLLWLAGCLPLVTVPASTAALFEVARLRSRGDDPAAIASFIAAYRQYLWPALAVGFGWAALGAILAVDLVIVAQMDGPIRSVLLVALLAVLLVYALVSVALFPVLVSFETRVPELVRTAVLVTLLFPARTLLGLAAVGAVVIAAPAVPLVILVAPSMVASTVQRLYRPAFDRLWQRSVAATSPPATGHEIRSTLSRVAQLAVHPTPATPSPKETSR